MRIIPRQVSLPVSLLAAGMIFCGVCYDPPRTDAGAVHSGLRPEQAMELQGLLVQTAMQSGGKPDLSAVRRKAEELLDQNDPHGRLPAEIREWLRDDDELKRVQRQVERWLERKKHKSTAKRAPVPATQAR